MISSSADGLIEKLARLIELKTITGKGNHADWVDYTAKELRNLHIETHLSNGYMSLFASTLNNKKPKILLQAHLDVVPGPDELFVLREETGRLTGRGVFDMKFAAACYLQIIEELGDDFKSYDLGIMFTTDEEVGGTNGVNFMLDHGYGADVCILPDGGDNWCVEASCNGLWLIELSAYGKSAHGSRPWEGSNAITKLTDTIGRLCDLFEDPEPGNSSLVISRIEGGEAMNQVPEHAKAMIDMRFVSDQDYQHKRVQVESLVIEHGLEINTLAHLSPFSNDLSNEYISAFMKTVNKVTGREIGTCHSLGASDAHYFKEHGIPTIVIRPTGGGAHSENEWIDKEELCEFYDVLKAYVMEYSRTLT